MEVMEAKSHEPLSIPYSLDYVFCIDASEGMKAALPRVKQQIHALISSSVEYIREYHRYRSIEQIRARLIVFRNYRYDDANSMVTTSFYDLLQEKDSFGRYLESIQAAVGGGSSEQSGLEALACAIRSNWTKNDRIIRRRHIVSLWTSSPPCELGYGKENEFYPQIGMATDFETLTAWWKNEEIMDGAKRLVLFAPEEGYWKQISETWDNVLHFLSDAGEGLDQLTMDQIIACIIN
jgi:hypothetical protein